MKKKNSYMLVGLLIILYNLAINDFTSYRRLDIYNLYYPSTFFTLIFTAAYFISFLKERNKRKKQALEISIDPFKIKNPMTNSFLILVNSFLLFPCFYFPTFRSAATIIIILPSFAGFNILCVYGEMKSKGHDKKFDSIEEKQKSKKHSLKGIIFTSIELLLILLILIFTSIQLNLSIPINDGISVILLPIFVIFNIVWVILKYRSNKGRTSHQLTLKIALILFGINLLLYAFLSEFTIFIIFLISIFLSVSGIIYTIQQLEKNKRPDSESHVSEAEELIDEHVDILRKLNGNT